MKKSAAALLILMLFCQVGNGTYQPRDYNIRRYGAVGDGSAKDTQSIQSAIDACAQSGGGTVRVPPGTYLTGTIQLRSGINLHLEHGAVLLASTDRSDYPPELGTPNRQHDGREIPDWSSNSGREHLIVARNETNVAITGQGIINGQGKVFFGYDGSGREAVAYGPKGWRPVRMVAFVECRDVTIQGVSLIDAPGFALWPLGCDTVAIEGVTIRSHGPNTDGIDIDCSQKVHISDCSVSTGDDAIALKSGTSRFGGRVVACENVTVTNCNLSSETCGVRVGYEGDAPIRNCTFSNLTISKTRTGLNMLVPYHPDYGIHQGPSIENILFQNIAMDVKQAFFLSIDDKAVRPGCIRNIVFSDIIATASRGNYIGGSGSIPVEKVRFDNVDVTLTGEMDDSFSGVIPYPYSIWGYWKRRGLPYGFYCRYVQDLSFRSVRIGWKDATGAWRSGFVCEEVENLDMDGVVAGPPSERTDSAVVHLSNVRNAFIRGCRLDSNAKTYLMVDGEKSSAITVLGNDLSGARNPLVIGDTVPENILFLEGNRFSGPVAKDAQLHRRTPQSNGAIEKTFTADVCVYGGTASGVMAAVAAKREGCSVIIVEASRWLGGMTGGGISQLDWGRKEAVGGTAYEILKGEPGNEVYRRVFKKLVANHDIKVIYDHRLGKVKKDGPSVGSISLDYAPVDETGCPIAEPVNADAGTVRAKIFVDCTYEGDLMAKSKVSYTFGRESREEYGESLAGVRPSLWVYDIEPYCEPGNPASGLIPFIQGCKIGALGSADKLTMGYCFRYKLGDGFAIPEPKNYDPAEFEIFRRGFKKGLDLSRARMMKTLGRIWEGEGYLFASSGSGNLNRSLLTTTIYGCNAEYPDGDWAARAKIWKFHQEYFCKLIHFLKTDSSVPAELKKQAETAGFMRGVFDETGGWPSQLYVREARRMISSYVVMQRDIEGKTDPEHSIGLASYGVDDWPYATVVEDGKVALQGGEFSILYLDEGKYNGIYKIPYEAIVPFKKECDNLLVPVCCSASHIAMTSIRMEPVWMILGESAGVAAAMAVKNQTSVQDVAYDELRAKLMELGQKLDRQSPRAEKEHK